MSINKSKSLLPDQVYGDEDFSYFSEEESDFVYENHSDYYAEEMKKLLKSLEIWDDIDLIDNSHVIYDHWPDKCARFLSDNNIRPDFFCQYDTILSQVATSWEQNAVFKREVNGGRRCQRPLKGKNFRKFSHDLEP